MLYHLSGRGSPPFFAMTIRARLGVISGRSDTARPPLSTKLYSWPVTSSPALRVYRLSDSSTGASYSEKPYDDATERQCSNSHVRNLMSGG